MEASGLRRSSEPYVNNMKPLPSSPLVVSIAQNSAGRYVAENLARLEQILLEAPPSNLLAFPEVFAVRGSDDDYRAAEESLGVTPTGTTEGSCLRDGPIVKWLRALAQRTNSWVLAGSLIEKDAARRYNTSLLINRSGGIAASYRKIHLFEARLGNGQVIRERDIYEAGSDPVTAKVEGWKCGLAVCYDLRFPELFRHYADLGAHLFFVPSNFTQKTGIDHWETLVRARAIENQAFIMAPDQCGENPFTGIESHGHSMIAGPWGEVLCRAGDEECVITAKLDPAELAKTRARIPVLEHRRLGKPCETLRKPCCRPK